MRLLFFNTISAIGGAERVLLTMIAALKRTYPAIEIVLIVGTDGELMSAAHQLGARVICLYLPRSLNQIGDSSLKSGIVPKLGLFLKLLRCSPAFLAYLRKLRRTIHRLQPTLIHSNSIKTHLTIALLGKLDAPIVWHIHDFYQARPLMANLLRRMSRNVANAIAVSNAIANDARKVLPLLPIQVVYNAVDVQSYTPIRTATQVVRIGLVATFARWKGHDIFLKAAAQVIREVWNVQFQIVGAPIYQTKGSQFSLQELQAQANALNLGTKVEFVGFRADTASIYNNLDIIVHASTQPEPFGLVIAEAMAFGKAVIVTNAGGAAELITDQYDAIAVPPGDVHALAQALIHLIQDPQKCQQLGQNARRTAIEQFNVDRVGQELLSIYQEYCPIDRSLEIANVF